MTLIHKAANELARLRHQIITQALKAYALLKACGIPEDQSHRAALKPTDQPDTEELWFDDQLLGTIQLQLERSDDNETTFKLTLQVPKQGSWSWLEHPEINQGLK